MHDNGLDVRPVHVHHGPDAYEKRYWHFYDQKTITSQTSPRTPTTCHAGTDKTKNTQWFISPTSLTSHW